MRRSAIALKRVGGMVQQAFGADIARRSKARGAFSSGNASVTRPHYAPRSALVTIVNALAIAAVLSVAAGFVLGTLFLWR